MMGFQLTFAILLLFVQAVSHFQHLVFEKNKGQAPADVQYLLRAPAYELHFKRGEVALHLKSSDLRIRFTGPIHKPSPEGHARLDGLIRYVNEPDDKRELPIYGSMRYESLYSGIDLLFYLRRTDLKTEFAVAAGTDPHQIQLAIEGADRIEVDESGDLVFDAHGQSLRVKHPIAFQPGRAKNGSVDVGYQVSNSNEVAFDVGPYDQTQPLIILIPST